MWQANRRVKRCNNGKTQYSKLWMTRWQVFVMFWISIYLISDIYYNQAINAITVINSLVLSIVGVMIPYFAKSYLETKESEKIRIKENAMLLEDDAEG